MTVENTSQRNPLIHYMGATSDGVTGYVTGMEAAGQQQVVHSDLLPVQGHADDQWLIDRGFQLGDVVEGDPLFRHVTLPEGWGREGTSHNMHSNIVDERGLPRVGVFYKAAFYDRRADWAPMDPARNGVTRFLYGDADSVPWDLFTAEEHERALAVLREHASGGEYDDKFATPGVVERADAELKRIA